MILTAVWMRVGALLDVTVPAPDASQLPASTALSNLVAGVEYAVLLACVGFFAWGGLELAAARNSGHSGGVEDGRKRMLRAAVAAIGVGCATFVINWAFHLGGTFR